MEEILKVEGLTKSFKQPKKLLKPQQGEAVKIAVNNLSFKANRGEIFGLLGPNGAGDYFMLFGLIISIVLVMISAFSVLSTLAKNVKESSAFITPLMIVIIVLGMCTTFFKSPHVALRLIPFLGSGIAMSSILALTASPLGVVLAILSNVVFAAVLIVLMGLMFKNENIMLKK